MDCFVSFAFRPIAKAIASFDCETLPPLPGLSTRIDEAELLGFN